MAIASSPRLLGEILVEEGLTTADVVAQALARAERAGERIGEALVAMGAVSSEDMLRALARQHNLTYLSRDELPVARCPMLKNLSPKYLRQYAVCPVSVDGNRAHRGHRRPPESPHRRRPAAEHRPRREARGQPCPRPSPRRSIAPMRAWRPRCSGSWRAWTRTGRPTSTRTSTTCATWPSRRRWCGSSISSSRTPSTRGPPTSTSSPSRTPCASGTASTASSTSRKRRPGACRRR